MIKIISLSYILVFLLCNTQVNAFQNDTTEVLKVAESKERPDIIPLSDADKTKNVIFLIGDGMGLAQITTAQYAIVGKDGLLNIQTMPVTGFVSTHSSDNLITDSAAGATAFACGLKTYNGAIGVNNDKIPCKTILELAREKGMSTGLVSTSSITHATPASFATHLELRKMQNKIAVQLAESEIEVLLGGGIRFFDATQRVDSLDLIKVFKNKGYQIVFNEEELLQIQSNKLLGLFANEGLERSGQEPSTATMTEKALDILSQNEKGFFLMVEGSQIDWAGHENDIEYLIREIVDFDNAVKSALDFAKKDKETLVILMADHETGGLTIQKQKSDGAELEVNWSTDYHTGTPIPLFAYGPGALELMGWRDNTFIAKKMAELLKLGVLPKLHD